MTEDPEEDLARTLIAIAIGLSMEEPVDISAIDKLIDGISESITERAALLSLLDKANNKEEICRIVADFISLRSAHHVRAAAWEADMDKAVGAWTQRIFAGGAIAVGGGIMTGMLGGLPLLIGIGVTILGGGVSTWGRLELGRREREARRRIELLASLDKGVRSVCK